MKPRFSLYAEVDTLAHANTIKNNINTQLSGKDIFETVGFSVSKGSVLDSNQFLISADWRFNNQTDRDSLKDWAQDQIQNNPQVKVWVTSAKLSWHSCSHDDSIIQDCSTTNYFEWVK